MITVSYTHLDVYKRQIYISALTQLNIDEHNRIPTTDGRLIRRIVRDARTRGASAKQTIAMWNSVRRGEEENIFPYQESADVMFNSALIYELAVLKLYAEPLLFSIEPVSYTHLNHEKQPLGCTCGYPVFSWITEGCKGKRQKQARMRIFLDSEGKREVYDSDWQQDIKSTAFCPNVQLSPRTRYFWLAVSYTHLDVYKRQAISRVYREKEEDTA